MRLASNLNLSAAKKAKNDEFYTQWADIEREMSAYLEYDPDIFRGKVVLLPCDDPEWSNFTKFFALHFLDYGIKKLISTSYAKPPTIGYQLTLLDAEAEQLDATRTRENGKIFVLKRHDLNGDGVVNLEALEWKDLDGDGDFRSAEVTALRDEADIVITNPPFSLFREFVAWLVAGDVEFSIIGNSCWFTNIEHGRRHAILQLMTMADNKTFSRHKEVKENGYKKYDNYDALDVPFTDAIPGDYKSVMGVPISFLDKYNPAQFEIIGASDNGAVAAKYKLPHTKKHHEPYIEGVAQYKRIFIQHRSPK